MADRRNILFLHIHNVAQGDFGCYGGASPLRATTPNIDRLVEQSLKLTNYNVGEPGGVGCSGRTGPLSSGDGRSCGR